MFTPTDLVSLNRVQSLRVSPCGEWAAVCVDRIDEECSKYISDIFRVCLKTGASLSLTSGDWNETSPRFDADGGLYFLSNRPTTDDDKKHDKRKQIWRSAGVGDPQQMTFEPLGVTTFEVSQDGTLFYQAMLLPDVEFEAQRETFDKKREHGPTAICYRPPQKVRFWDHWIPNLEKCLIVHRDERKEFFRGEIESWVITPSGEKLFAVLYRKGVKRLRQDRIVEIDPATGDQQTIKDCESFFFSLAASENRLAFVEQKILDDDIGRYELSLFDLGSREITIVAKRHEDRLYPQSFSEDGSLYLTGDFRGDTPVFCWNGELQQLTTNGGTHGSVFACAETLCGVRSTASEPPEVFRVEGEEAVAISSIAGYEKGDLSISNHFTESTDGTPIHHRHVRLNDQEKRPMLLWIHGGPLGAWGDVWHWRWNPVVAANFGYHVVCPNPRGSTGFGQKMISDMFGDVWGGQCYEDVMAVADACEASPLVDETKTCAMGGSFGGYMTNWIGTQTDRFDCLVTHASIADNHGFFGTTDSPPWWSHMFQKNPYDDRTALDKYSPIRHVESWKTPTLIVHGDKDYRVPITESLTLYDALDYHDVDCELMVFPDENHWILRPKNAVYWYDEIFDYIGRYLG